MPDDEQEDLSHNTSADPESKGIEDLDPMHHRNWSGGSINEEAKQVARGEVAPDQPAGPDAPPPGVPPIPTTSTRPWSPDPTTGDDAPASGVDPIGRPRDAETTDAPRRSDVGEKE